MSYLCTSVQSIYIYKDWSFLDMDMVISFFGVFFKFSYFPVYCNSPILCLFPNSCVDRDGPFGRFSSRSVWRKAGPSPVAWIGRFPSPAVLGLSTLLRLPYVSGHRHRIFRFTYLTSDMSGLSYLPPPITFSLFKVTIDSCACFYLLWLKWVRWQHFLRSNLQTLLN